MLPDEGERRSSPCDPASDSSSNLASEAEIRILQEPLVGREELVDLYLRAYRPLKRSYYYSSERRVRGYFAWLRDRDPEGTFVAYVGGRPAGFIAADAHWERGEKLVGALHELVVAPEFQGRGLGRRLIERALEYLRQQGRERAELWVGERNERALRLYERLGFRRAGRWHEWIRMVKDLD